ncbi:MAG: TDP-N-acetylfucosamine:lipid II N-acetylfucosaminyltransferase [Firmicutes bacterium]|nr:TDP-N-acetylfucosamine:lipid II N-acetylfucosaminyltransferase [Bacillota bacterium]
MKILHIFKNTNKKFYKPYIEFINKNFILKDHKFMIEVYNNSVSIDKISNVEYIRKKDYFKLILKMYKADKIILHSLMSPRIMILLFLQPWFLKKCYWVVWGADLYYYKEPRMSLRKKIHESMRKLVIKNMGNVCTLVKGDYDLAKKWYGVKGGYFKAAYVSDKGIKSRNKIISNLNYLSLKNDKVRVIVGNSATPTNNHIEVFNILKKFKDENIEIVCPLSYGDMKYAKRIKDYGYSLFKNKLISLDTFMDMEDYMLYLSKIDIGIFNNNRQQGMGNIFSMLHLGKKVYIRNDTTMWEEIIKYRQLVVFDIKEIEKMDFERFKQLDTIIAKENMRKCKESSNSNHAKEIWTKIF